MAHELRDPLTPIRIAAAALLGQVRTDGRLLRLAQAIMERGSGDNPGDARDSVEGAQQHGGRISHLPEHVPK